MIEELKIAKVKFYTLHAKISLLSVTFGHCFQTLNYN